MNKTLTSCRSTTNYQPDAFREQDVWYTPTQRKPLVLQILECSNFRLAGTQTMIVTGNITLIARQDDFKTLETSQ